MSTATNSRARARETHIEAIKGVARKLIAEKSVAGLSLREVSREMGLVSSALYRYFATRDELLTALILDAYNDLGRSVERADAKVARADAYGRWKASARAIRRWATKNPHEYALIYGTPIPGYVAPTETIDAAARVARVLGAIMGESRQTSAPSGPRRKKSDVSRYLEVDGLAAIMPGVAPEDYLKALMAWTEIFGFLTFELFGQYVGTVKNASLMFDDVVNELAISLKLKP
ncbi:MAG TPA: TetR/AcrR family transcriptional regulator [Acidimicrobiales bacterium]|jgi:AcrR family transcriptional regulator|nr:TetR/AcrR family transcriptional regulator [Acidimicrobiales bacterium]